MRQDLLAAAVAACFAGGASANPTGAHVVQGTVSMSNPAAGVLQIVNSPNSIINWQKFSIGQGELTQFLQQSAASAVLNRVVTSDPSSILGTLQSNGRVFLINPNGIVFGQNSVVDVAGLVASSLNMSDGNFSNGKLIFDPTPGAGAVVNNGIIFSGTQGVGGHVYLVGPAVTNGGLISTPQGATVLAAGESVELVSPWTPDVSVKVTASGNEALNLGQIFADSGKVGIYAGLIQQQGTLSANTVVAGEDGSIRLVAAGATTFAAGSSTMGGRLDIDTGDLTIAGSVNTGPQTISATGGLTVRGDAMSAGQLSAQGGQTINAGFLEVNAAGGWATIFNFGGEQRISTTGANPAGEGLAVRNSGGGFASIQNTSGQQIIDVRNADRAVLDSAQGPAFVFANDGIQTFTVTGAGDNALVLGSAGSIAQSVIGGGHIQTVVAGQPGEEGSITIYGTASGGPTNNFIVSAPAAGGTQTVSTSGALSVFGGTAPGGGTSAGIFANGIGGQQTVNAGSILLQGGSFGSGNSAVIGANNGSQTVNVGAGGITLRGGAEGANNFAMINQASTDPAATQEVTSTGPVLLESGGGNFNFTMIRAFGGHQSFEAGATTLLAGATGIDNFASIQARSQDMTVHGDLAITARGSAGTPAVGGGARIGGTGGASPSATDLRLIVEGDYTMTAGSLAGTGVLLGNSTNFTGDTDIDVTVGGDFVMNGGSVPGTFATIGSRAASPAGGNIALQAGGAIALNSTSAEQASILRTLDGVKLTAQSITQGADSRIEAGSLTVETAHGASLGGANSVNQLSMLNTASGAVDFNNTSLLLTVTGIDQVKHGALNLEQAGDLRITGDVTSGAQTITATGDITATPGAGSGLDLHARGAQTITAGGSFNLLGGSAWDGYAEASSSGTQRITTGGDLIVRGGSGLLAAGLLYGKDDVHLTVGNELRLDRGTGLLALARVQTDFGERIFLSFPNRASGGYFVDGREGVVSWGLDGFFAGLLPARGRSLVLTYGQ